MTRPKEPNGRQSPMPEGNKYRAAMGMISAALAALASAPAYAQCPSEDVFTNFDGCAEIWEDVGLPTTLKDVDGDTLIEVCHLGYATLYNTETKNPEWVIANLTKERVAKKNTRPHIGFKPDPCVDTEQSARNTDYTNSKYARGHQAASADFAFNKDWMKDTFFFSNAVPQIGAGFNSGIWSSLENRIQRLTKDRGKIITITGPVYREPGNDAVTIPATQNACGGEIVIPAIEREAICGGTGSNPDLSCDAGVEIPIALFKIIYNPELERVNAYIIPNYSHTKKKRGQTISNYLEKWRVSVQNVEERVEHDFFPHFTAHERRSREESCPATMVR